MRSSVGLGIAVGPIASRRYKRSLGNLSRRKDTENQVEDRRVEEEGILQHTLLQACHERAENKELTALEINARAELTLDRQDVTGLQAPLGEEWIRLLEGRNSSAVNPGDGIKRLTRLYAVLHRLGLF